MGKILVADDSSTIQKVVRITLANEAHQLVECMSEEELESCLKSHTFDLILLDYNLSTKRSGEQLAQWVKTLSPAPVMAMLGTFDTVEQSAITNAGYSDSIVKPFESEIFISKCRQLIEGTQPQFEQIVEEPQIIEVKMEEDDLDLSMDNWTVQNEAKLPPQMKEAAPAPAPAKKVSTTLSTELEDWGIEIPGVIGDAQGEALLPPVIGGVDDLAHFSMTSTDTLLGAEEIEESEVHFDLDSTSSFDIREFEAKFDQALPQESDLAYPDNSNVEDMDEEVLATDDEDPFAGMHVEMVSLDDLDPEDASVADDISFEQTDPHNQVEAQVELEKELEIESADDLWAVDETISSSPSALPKEESYGGIESNADFVEHIQFEAQELPQSAPAAVSADPLTSISLDELAEKIRESLAPMIETVIRQECMRIADQIAEKVAWEVIPDLAENIIRKEIKALTDSID